MDLNQLFIYLDIGVAFALETILLIFYALQKNIFPSTKNYAWIIDDKGEPMDFLNIGKGDTFNYKHGKKTGTYNILIKEATMIKANTPFAKRRIFFYNVNNPNPLKLDKKLQPLLTPEQYKIQLETHILSELNNLANDGIGKYLTFKNILIALIVIAVIIYVATGHSLIPK